MTTLSTLRIGDHGKIVGFHAHCEQDYRHQLLAMGLTRGTTFQVIHRAPLGDPVAIKVRGFLLGLRQQETTALLIEKIMP